MYAIIETGGKQYRVAKGDLIDIELIKANDDGKVEFTQVLFINDGNAIKIGGPHLPKAMVKGEFVQETKGPKVIAFKYKRRKGYRRKVGHRQRYTQVRITEILG